jgi:subtilase family serine protease
VTKGAAFDFSYVIKNAGGASSGMNWAGYTVDHQVDSSHYTGFGQTNALAAGATQTLNGRIETSSLSVGQHTLYVAADYWNNMVGESNESNNTLSVTFNVTDHMI